MPHVGLMFPSKYLRGDDVLEAGGMIVTITRVQQRSLRRADGSEEQCWLASVKESDKLWVLSRTTANQIAKLYGKRNSDDWPGLRVRLTTEHGKWFGKESDAIRVSSNKPAQSAPKAAPPKAPPVDFDALLASLCDCDDVDAWRTAHAAETKQLTKSRKQQLAKAGKLRRAELLEQEPQGDEPEYTNEKELLDLAAEAAAHEERMSEK